MDQGLAWTTWGLEFGCGAPIEYHVWLFELVILMLAGWRGGGDRRILKTCSQVNEPEMVSSRLSGRPCLKKIILKSHKRRHLKLSSGLYVCVYRSAPAYA